MFDCLVDSAMKLNWKTVVCLAISCVLFLGFTIPLNNASAKPSTKWIKTFDGTSDDEIFSVIEGNDFGYILAGTTNSSGFGQYDGWIIKTDSSGVMEWNQTYGGLFNDGFYSLVTTSDGGYALAGYTNSSGLGKEDAWLVKVDSQGNLDWSKTFGGSESDFARSLVTTSDGGFMLACETNSSDSKETDIWLIKVDSSGSLEWNQTYGGSGFEFVSTIIETNDGGYLLASSTTSFGTGDTDVWLIKINSIGDVEWNHTYGESQNDFVNSLVSTNDGGYCFAGSTSSFYVVRTDVWLVKVNSVGSLEWDQTYDGLLLEYCDSLVVTNDGGYLLGNIEQPPFFGTFGEGKFLLNKVDTAGKLEWEKNLGISAPQSRISLVSTVDGSYILAGSTLDSAGTRDFWMTKISGSETLSELQLYILITIFLILMVAGFLFYRKKVGSARKIH